MSTRQPIDARPQLGPGSRWYGWVFGTVWLIYLLKPLSDILDGAGWRRIVGTTSIAVFVALYIASIRAFRRQRFVSQPIRGARTNPVQTWSVLAGLAVAIAGMVPGAGESALNAAPFLGAMMVMRLQVRVAIASVALLVAVVEFTSNLAPAWSDSGYGFGVMLAAIATFAIRLAFDRTRALVAAEGDLVREEERSRIARDLHDILGHSLTVIAVKAELAERMLDVDPERARLELVDLQKLSRDALADVRTTALGTRGVSLLNEIASARLALESAGIDAVLPTVADDVPTQWRETFAWTIRECVTNVIRHSRARRCVVEMSPSALTVEDDGVGFGVAITDGSGLAGLRRRVEAVGARLMLGSGSGGRGALVRVDVPR